MSITVCYELQQQDLQCCVCFEDMAPPLIQCSTGNHFVCESCRVQMKRNCPVCRTSKLFHNQFLEKSITFTKCDYCPRRLFSWSIESHQKQCIYQPSECFSCKKTLNLSELKHHIRSNECDTEWMESSFEETACSFESLEYCKRTIDGFQLNLTRIQKNFVLILNEMFLFFLRNSQEWRVGLIDLKEHSVIDLHYPLIKTDFFSQENIISIHSKSTLFEWNQLQEAPMIPLSVKVVEIVIKIEIDDASVEGFFSNLLRQQM